VVEALVETPAAVLRPPRGVVWLTPVKVITPMVAPSMGALLKFTTTL